MEQNNQQDNYYNPQPQMTAQPVTEEKASVGLAILSFLIPLAGLIIFLVNRDKRPKTAKTSGICALVSFLIALISSIILTVTGAGVLFSALSDSSDDSDSDSSYSQDVDAESSDKGKVLTGNTIGDYECTVKNAVLCKNWENKDCVLITYEFTNNSSDSTSFDAALQAKPFQNGIGLETTFLSDDETDLLDVEIKPGVTKEVKKAYVLGDTQTEIEIEISELFSFTDEKIVTKVNLTK